MMHTKTLFGTVSTVGFIAIFAWTGVVIYSTVSHRIAQRNWSHTTGGFAQRGVYPSVMSHSILDHSGAARIIMLHKLTRPLPKTIPNRFYWVDLIAMDPVDKQLECKIAGQQVWIEPAELQVFYTVDSGAPTKIELSGTSVPFLASPQAVWNDLVQPHIDSTP
jgi:hypothetical protein